MGWYGSYKSSKADEVAECSKGALAKSLKGSVLWTVREGTKDNGEKIKFIGCDLIEKHGDNWMHKPLDESMHPYYYSCPLKFLEMAPEACPEWRAKVREFHARAARKFAVGDTVKLIPNVKVRGTPIDELKLVSVKPLVGWSPAFGNVRIAKRLIA